MRKYNGDQIRYYLSDKEWGTLGKVMFDNHTVEDRQKVFSMYIQLKETVMQLCKDGIRDAESEYKYDTETVFRPDDAANDQGRIVAYNRILETLDKFNPILDDKDMGNWLREGK